MSIKDILQEKGRHVETVRPTDTVQSAVEKLAQHNIGAMVVEDPWMHPVGIFSERDFVKAVARHGSAALEMKVDALMSAPIISCLPSAGVEDAMTTMTMAKIRHLPVIEDGRLQGIVSIGDLVKRRLGEKALEADVLLDLTRMRA
jgi:CBS domain-containing protein